MLFHAKKNISKIISITLFTLLLFTNIKVALLDDNDIINGNIDFLVFKIQLFENCYAGSTTIFSDSIWRLDCTYGPNGELELTGCYPGGEYYCECP